MIPASQDPQNLDFTTIPLAAAAAPSEGSKANWTSYIPKWIVNSYQSIVSNSIQSVALRFTDPSAYYESEREALKTITNGSEQWVNICEQLAPVISRFLPRKVVELFQQDPQRLNQTIAGVLMRAICKIAVPEGGVPNSIAPLTDEELGVKITTQLLRVVLPSLQKLEEIEALPDVEEKEQKLQELFQEVAQTLLTLAFPGKDQDPGFPSSIKMMLAGTLNWFGLHLSWQDIANGLGTQLFSFYNSYKEAKNYTPALLNSSGGGERLVQELHHKILQEIHKHAQIHPMSEDEAEMRKHSLIYLEGLEPRSNYLLDMTAKKLLEPSGEGEDHEILQKAWHWITQDYLLNVLNEVFDKHLKPQTGTETTPQKRAFERIENMLQESDEGIEALNRSLRALASQSDETVLQMLEIKAAEEPYFKKAVSRLEEKSTMTEKAAEARLILKKILFRKLTRNMLHAVLDEEILQAALPSFISARMLEELLVTASSGYVVELYDSYQALRAKQIVVQEALLKEQGMVGSLAIAQNFIVDAFEGWASSNNPVFPHNLFLDSLIKQLVLQAHEGHPAVLDTWNLSRNLIFISLQIITYDLLHADQAGNLQERAFNVVTTLQDMLQLNFQTIERAKNDTVTQLSDKLTPKLAIHENLSFDKDLKVGERYQEILSIADETKKRQQLFQLFRFIVLHEGAQELVHHLIPQERVAQILPPFMQQFHLENFAIAPLSNCLDEVYGALDTLALRSQADHSELLTSDKTQGILNWVHEKSRQKITGLAGKPLVAWNAFVEALGKQIFAADLDFIKEEMVALENVMFANFARSPMGKDPHRPFATVLSIIKLTAEHAKGEVILPADLSLEILNDKKRFYNAFSERVLAIVFPRKAEELPVPPRMKQMAWDKLCKVVDKQLMDYFETMENPDSRDQLVLKQICQWQDTLMEKLGIFREVFPFPLAPAARRDAIKSELIYTIQLQIKVWIHALFFSIFGTFSTDVRLVLGIIFYPLVLVAGFLWNRLSITIAESVCQRLEDPNFDKLMRKILWTALNASEVSVPANQKLRSRQVLQEFQAALLPNRFSFLLSWLGSGLLARTFDRQTYLDLIYSRVG